MYEEVLQLIRDCREQYDLEPLGQFDLDFSLEYTEDVAGLHEKDKNALYGDEVQTSGGPSTTSTASLLFSNLNRDSCDARKTQSFHSLFSKRGFEEGESMLLHIHNVRSPLNSFLEILQSLSYVGQRRATEDGMVMMSYKLRKLVMSHLSKWESDYDCKLAVKRNQRQRKSQFHQDSVRHRNSYALSTARGYQDGDMHGHMSLTRSKSRPPFRVSEIDFSYNSRKSITTPGKMESARASNTPHVTRDSNYQEMRHIDSDHFLREFLLKSGRLIKRELNVIAMKILRPHWIVHVVTMRVKNALLMLLDRVASARLWSDVESQQLKHLHNAHRAVASTDARTGTDKNSGSKSTLGEARAIPSLGRALFPLLPYAKSTRSLRV